MRPWPPAPADLDGLRGLVRRVDRRHEPVRAVVESTTGARFVHDTLEELGWAPGPEPVITLLLRGAS